MMYIAELFLIYDGRMSRITYLITSLSLFLLCVIGVVLIAYLGSLFLMAELVYMLLILFCGVIIWSGTCINIKRLHDIGVSGWWCLLPPVVILLTMLVFHLQQLSPQYIAESVNLLFGLALLFIPPNNMNNPYDDAFYFARQTSMSATYTVPSKLTHD